jgi:hypothetical protein
VRPSRLIAIAAALSIQACAEARAPTVASRLEIAVAPLTLPGLSKVCYDLRTTNAADGGGTTVWREGDPAVDGLADADSLCSTRYGTGPGGDITFVGSCDASPDSPGDTGRTNSVTLWVDSLYATGGALIAEGGPDGWQDPCPSGCTLNATCQENTDTRIEFNLTILRQANQGFFDIGVNFDDIFCSAKVDCVDSAGAPLKLLFNPATGLRDTTIVSAFACTAGVGASTVLYRDPLVVTCDGASTSLPPGSGKGNAWTNASADPAPTDAIWQYAVYAGEEDLTCSGEPCSKRYWNVAFGLTPAADNCTLTTKMTAAAGPLAEFSTPASTTYPYISVNLPLTDASGLICGKHPLNGDTDVSTSYTGLSSPKTFETSYSSTGFANRVPVCPDGCLNGGSCTADGTCTCLAGWSGATCAVPVCASGCNNGTCSAPGLCTCTSGWSGSTCLTPVCASGCVNGTCTSPDTCSCATGWSGANCATPNCTTPCANAGVCVAPDICDCADGWVGTSCETAAYSGGPIVPALVTTGLALDLDAGRTASYGGSGTTWTDLSGYGRHAEFPTAPTYASAHQGGLVLNRTTDFASISNDAGLRFNQSEITVDAWFKIDANDDARQSIYTTSASGAAPFLTLGKARSGLAGFNSGAIYFGISQTTTENIVSNLTGAQLVSAGIVNYTAILKNNGGTSWQMRLYRNGVLDAERTVTLSFDFSAFATTTRVGSFSPTTPDLFGGTLYSVRVYTRALSADEVAMNYDSQIGRYRPLSTYASRAGLKLYFDPALSASYPGTGTLATDVSGSGYTANLNNGTTYSAADDGAFVFNDTSSSIDLNQTNVDVGNRFTTEGWVYMNDIGGNSGGWKREGLMTNAWSWTQNQGFTTVMSSQMPSQAPASGYETFFMSLGQDQKVATTAYGSVLPRRWIHYAAVANGTELIRLYINGQETSYLGQTDANINLTYTLSPLTLGRTNNMDYLNGRLTAVRLYSRALSPAEIYRNYRADLDRFAPQVADPDAQRFVDTAGILVPHQARAISTLVADLKQAGLWDKLAAVYPMVGGRSGAHKFNLKDPRDLDEAYRLKFYGSWVHTETGAKPDGATAYADTSFNPSVRASLNDTSLSFYGRTTRTNQSRALMGVIEGSTPRTMALRAYASSPSSFASSSAMYDAAGSDTASFTDTEPRGFYVGSKTQSNLNKVYKNGALRASSAVDSAAGLPARNIALGALGGSAVTQYDNVECSFASIGKGLTDAEVASLHAAVQGFQIALGRHIEPNLVMNLDAGNYVSMGLKIATTWNDLSGQSLHASLVNGVAITDASGGVMTFDGNNDYTSTTDSDLVNFANRDFSMEIWYRHSVAPTDSNSNSTDNQYLISQRQSGGNYLFLFVTGTELRFDTWANDVQGPQVVVTTTPNTSWTHVVVTGAGNTFSIYRNGTLLGSSTSAVALKDLPAPFELGRWSGGSRYLKGQMGVFRAWNGRALTATEIADRFAATKVRFGL